MKTTEISIYGFIIWKNRKENPVEYLIMIYANHMYNVYA